MNTLAHFSSGRTLSIRQAHASCEGPNLQTAAIALCAVVLSLLFLWCAEMGQFHFPPAREMLSCQAAGIHHHSSFLCPRRTYAKGFGAMGALFAGSECVIEKTRAKHDIYNSVYAGCFTGGSIAYSTGPKGMCAGCLTFAAFSALIDKIMEHD